MLFITDQHKAIKRQNRKYKTRNWREIWWREYTQWTENWIAQWTARFDNELRATI